MKWKRLYEQYGGWSAAALERALAALEDLGPAGEIVEVAGDVCSEQAAVKLIRRAIAAGVRFSGDELLILSDLVDTKTLEAAILSSLELGTTFSTECILDLEGLVDEGILTAILRAHLDRGISYTAAQILELDGAVDPSVLTLAAERSRAAFTREDLTDLQGVVDYDVLQAIDRRQGTRAFGGRPANAQPGPLAVSLALCAGRGKSKDAPRFRVGDHVRVRHRGQEGTIVDINGSLCMVSLQDGRYVDSYEASQLEKAW